MEIREALDEPNKYLRTKLESSFKAQCTYYETTVKSQDNVVLA